MAIFITGMVENGIHEISLFVRVLHINSRVKMSFRENFEYLTMEQAYENINYIENVEN